MADSNNGFVTTADGRTITYERWQYEQSVRQEAVLKQVNDLMMDEATNAVSVGVSFGQQDYGALLRKVIPNLFDKYGTINAQAAVDYYNALAVERANQTGGSLVNVKDRRTSDRYARTRLNAMTKVANGYSAQFADDYDAIGKTDRVINWAMKVRAQSGHQPSVTAMNNALSREVAMYHRDTILFNASIDPYVKGVQRVAQASACNFCRMMALGSTRGSVRVSQYAAKFHSHCHCTITPLFEGDKPIRPDYYDKFEQEYADAYRGGSLSDTMSHWREVRKETARFASNKFDTIGDLIDGRNDFLKFINNGKRGLGDKSLYYVLKGRKMLDTPELVDQLTGDGILYRGIQPETAKWEQLSWVDAFKRSNNPFQGQGVYGNGSYFTSSYDDALEYAGNSNSGLIAAQFKDTANVMRFANPNAYYDYIATLERKYTDELASRGLTDSDMGNLSKNGKASSILMALNGVDGYSIESNGYSVVLNRGALRVER